MKVAVVGCTHAGTAAVMNIKNNHPDCEVTVYERNDNVSFLSCGIALYVCGVVEDQSGLFYSSPEQLKERGINTLIEHDVTNIDFEKKQLTVTNLLTNEVFVDRYDKLIIATGSWPIIPNIEGIYSDNVLLSKNFMHSIELIEKSQHVNHITVVGAGYIGVELAEAFRINGKEVTLIDAEERIMFKYLDKEFTDLAEAEFTKNGIQLALGEKVQRFMTSDNRAYEVVTNKGNYKTDLVIMCIGFRPNTSLVSGYLDTLPNGAIKVNEYMETSRNDVYACGDCASILYNPVNETRYIPLATNAVRMGTIVGKNIKERVVKHPGTQGTSGIKIYELNISSTGITESMAKESGIQYGVATVKDNNRPEFMPTFSEVTLKIVYDKNTLRIIGGQIMSKEDVTQTINTLSACIYKNMTIDELAFVDFFFQPNFNKPWNILNLTGLEALKNEGI